MRKLFDGGADCVPEVVDRPRRGFLEPSLELGEGELGRIDVRRVGREKAELRAPNLYRLVDGRKIGRREVVENNDAARSQRRCQILLDIRLEGATGYRFVEGSS